MRSPFMLAIVATASPVAAAAGQQSGAPDLILINARVYTVDDRRPWASAVAIRDGRIVAVGDARQAMRQKGTGTRVVDLKGRLLMPAFGDAHAHPIFGGMAYSRCSLHAGSTLVDYQRIIADCIKRTPGTGTVVGSGWNQTLFANGIPRKDVLDAVSRDRALVFESDGHTLWVNSKALELAGITRDTPNPANGKIDRDQAGEPIGGLEESAMALVDKLVPPPSDADLQGAVRYTVKLFNGLGITSWHDAALEWEKGGTSRALDAYAELRDAGGLTVHTVMDLRWNNDRGGDQLADIVRVSAAAKASGFIANGVKFFIDGVIPQRTAAMLAHYSGSRDKGAPQISPAALADAATRVAARGMQLHFHAIGDAGVRQALDAVAATQASGGRRDTRPMISHLNVIDPADQPRFGKLDVTAVFQPLWACHEPYMDLTIKTIGPVRSRYIYPAAGVAKGGGRIAYGADWPVASANPIEGIEVAVTRIAPGSDEPPLLPEQAVPLRDAVRNYTINAAYVNHLDHVTGSITPGKSADLVVLDKDLFRLAPRQIHTAKVMLTLFQGKPVYGTLEAAAK
jgi:predicted amidohydrolase YtcJ